MIVDKQNNQSYELELRIDFKNPNNSYSNCLITRFLDSEYIHFHQAGYGTSLNLHS